MKFISGTTFYQCLLLLASILVSASNALQCATCLNRTACASSPETQECTVDLVTLHHGMIVNQNPNLNGPPSGAYKCYDLDMSYVSPLTGSTVLVVQKGCTYNTTIFCDGWTNATTITRCATCDSGDDCNKGQTEGSTTSVAPTTPLDNSTTTVSSATTSTVVTTATAPANTTTAVPNTEGSTTSVAPTTPLDNSTTTTNPTTTTLEPATTTTTTAPMNTTTAVSNTEGSTTSVAPTTPLDNSTTTVTTATAPANSTTAVPSTTTGSPNSTTTPVAGTTSTTTAAPITTASTTTTTPAGACLGCVASWFSVVGFALLHIIVARC